MTRQYTRRSALALSGSAIAVSLAGCLNSGSLGDLPPAEQPPTEPQQYQYDAQNTNVTGTSPPTDNDLLWRKRRDELNANDEPIDGLVAREDHLVVATREAIHSLDPSDGTERWRAESGQNGRTPAVTPVLSAETAYVAWNKEGEAGLSALDLSDGSEQWWLDSINPISSPTLVEGTIYVSALESGKSLIKAILAVDAADGRVLWRFPTGQMSPTPAVADGTVYVGGGKESIVYAIDAETGDKQWEFPTADRVHMPPTVVDETVYIASDFADRLYALDATEGTETWSKEMNVSASVAATSNTVYVPVMDTIKIFDSDDGTHQWTESLSDTSIGSAPVIAGETLLVPGDRAVCLDLTDGTHLWEQTVEEGIVGHEKKRAVSCAPVVTEDGVFLGTAAGDIYAIGT
ncbi:PQQ-binding-like beta-propeller repeat protein [Halovenus rubra]|uniref:PQQ-binding-like beta-propeller repeat protein n=2 Tax=Halovenus rubra TaxID=869890 RepID=A0ACC7DZB8_9EURY|nr:PQQ-binding-like beta-propeller repeat protein [Halovenus rubra]